MTYPAFRFKRWLYSRMETEGWFQHFNDRKIPAAVVKNKLRYSVWRIGTELRCPSTVQTRKSRDYEQERIKGEIVEACHLFKEYLR